MSTPFFPNELITQIFESLYTALRSNPLYYPISVNSIFAPFTLVDKRWRSLSLPYLVRHYDRPTSSITGFLDLVKKYDLMKEVKSIHFGFDIPAPQSLHERQAELIEVRYGGVRSEYEENEAYERIENEMEGWIMDTADDAVDLVIDERQRKVQEETHRWEPLISTCMPHVDDIEVGKRSMDENWDDNSKVYVGRKSGG